MSFLNYKFRIYPSPTQQRLIIHEIFIPLKHLWNRLLEEAKKEYEETGNSDTRKFTLAKKCNGITKTHPLLSVTMCRGQNRRLSRAFEAFFKRVKRGEKPGYPKFKRRVDSFTIEDTKDKIGLARSLETKNNRVKIPKLGWMPIRLHRPWQGTPKTLNLSQAPDGCWFITVGCKQSDTTYQRPIRETVGIDVGIGGKFATLSTGEVISMPKNLMEIDMKVKRLQKTLSRKKKGSRNRQKCRQRLARLRRKAKRKTEDWLHKVTTKLVERFDAIHVEDLDIRGLMEKRQRGMSQKGQRTMRRNMSSSRWDRFVQFLTYKQEFAGGWLIKVSPTNTTKRCSVCGHVKPMPLSNRTYECEECENVMDRDLNAAINILSVGQAEYSPGEEASATQATLTKG